MIITFDYLLQEINSKFPDFIIDEDMDGLPTVIFSFLTGYLIDHIDQKDEKIINKFVVFLNEISNSEDSSVGACVDEIILGLYSDSKIDYRVFMSRLSNETIQRFQVTIDLWKRGSSISS